MKKEILVSVKDFPKDAGASRNYAIDHQLSSPDPSNFKIIKNISGNVQLIKVRKLYLASFFIFTEIKVPCARCLATITKKINLKFQREYSTKDINNNLINLSPAISEELMLHLPIKILCKETCKGLCAYCGKDLNTSKCGCKSDEKSPFEKLKKLRIES
jgi:uncharacterized protein